MTDPDEHARQIGAINASMREVLSAAAGIAGRGRDLFNGTDACSAFHEASVAILKFMDEAPELDRLKGMSIPPSLKKAKPAITPPADAPRPLTKGDREMLQRIGRTAALLQITITSESESADRRLRRLMKEGYVETWPHPTIKVTPNVPAPAVRLTEAGRLQVHLRKVR